MLISIITINYNDVEGLKKTMTSVLDQTYVNIEYIIIDGGSTDGSMEYIETHQKALTYWLSEPDKGVYDAMNKGLKKATGDYVFFLNSGDTLHNETIIEMVVNLKPTEDIIYGHLEIKEKSRTRIKVYPQVLTFEYFLKDSLPHSGGGFFKKGCFVNDLSHYDSTLKIMADWKWSVIGLFKKGYSYRLVDTTIGVFEYGNGISSLPENRELLNMERKLILNEEFKYLYAKMITLLAIKKSFKRLMKTKLLKTVFKLKKTFQKK
ncbi:MAG: glycosyltransferase family 2 protein [bacterium]|nr:glycosyltransferase family 2 protein [bacterium]